jgi:hypothetical protein
MDDMDDMDEIDEIKDEWPPGARDPVPSMKRHLPCGVEPDLSRANCSAGGRSS